MVPQRVGGNQGNVPAPLAQRRLVQFDHPQPMVKILAEAAFGHRRGKVDMGGREDAHVYAHLAVRSEEHTSELQSLMRISYAVFCLKKKKNKTHIKRRNIT